MFKWAHSLIWKQLLLPECANHAVHTWLQTTDSCFFSLFPLSFNITNAGHFNQARPCVVRPIQQHTDTWPQHGGSGAPSCQSHGSGEMSLSLIVLCFSVLHASEFHFLCLNMFCQGKKRPIPNLYCPAFDRKHLTACGFTAASQIK